MENLQKRILKQNMREIFTVTALFIAGAAGYSGIEIAFRGYTHWSMALTGGAVLVTFYYLNNRYKDASLFMKAIGGMLVITAYEFAVGCIVNLLFGWQVWDYSELPYDILGQVCPLFSFLWFFLCFFLAAVASLFYRSSS